MQSRPYTWILWDWNGTLLNDGDYGTSIINRMLAARGLPERSRAEHGRIFDFPVIHYYERAGFDFTKEPFEVMSAEFVRNYLANALSCELHAGVREVLAGLQTAGFRQAILSASHQDHLEMFIRHHQLESFFEELLGIQSIHAPGKVDRGLRWLEHSGHDANEILLIGDTLHDAEVARAMGIDCWLVSCGHQPEDRLRGTGLPCLKSPLDALAALT